MASLWKQRWTFLFSFAYHLLQCGKCSSTGVATLHWFWHIWYATLCSWMQKAVAFLMMIFAIEAFEEWENSLCKGLAWAYKCLARLPLQAQPTTHSQSLFREAPSSSMQCKKLIFVAVHWRFSVKHKRGLLCTVWSCRAQQAGSPISCFLLPIFGHAGLRTLCLWMKIATLLKCPTNKPHGWSLCAVYLWITI